ncbi:hypothetical protein L596_013607 [Steinernema carpocapsae]|uniref:Uncharacterized protein n=1 Tax=Steinernema carpocapsae TaxID=34508 RepID=A0A4U5P1J2_STECR|nr:hypothetical protein L596_013607 [Steinernema carpocapsae]
MSLIASCPISPGTSIVPSLPFMLFGSDSVSRILLKEPTCVFVDSTDLVNMTSFVLTSIFPNGTCTSTSWSKISNAEKWCFEETTSEIAIFRDDIFAGYSEVNPEWRAAVLLFLAKKSLTGRQKQLQNQILNLGDCSDGNVLSLIDDVSVKASAACPAYVLVPNGRVVDGNDSPSICPTIAVRGSSVGVNPSKIFDRVIHE